jgi:hypothetical protein
MKGSCLCGAIEYEIDSIDMPVTHCHCRTCQKAHAAPFAATAGVMREHFRWLEGEDKLSFFESSPGKQRYFCSVCGSHLIAERVSQPHVIGWQRWMKTQASRRNCIFGQRMMYPGSNMKTFPLILNGSRGENENSYRKISR